MFTPSYPNHQFKIKGEKDKELIFDELRKVWLRLTPEEWVRQNTIQLLVVGMQYPATLIAVEKEISLGELKKRFDLMIYDRNHKPWMIIECKATHVPLSQSVLEQVLRYNISVPVPFLTVTNGTLMAAFERADNGLSELSGLPPFP